MILCLRFIALSSSSVASASDIVLVLNVPLLLSVPVGWTLLVSLSEAVFCALGASGSVVEVTSAVCSI